MKIDTKNFIAIQGWMRSELNLSGNELIAYALIYGFSQDGESAFKGSLQFIADWLGVTKNNARLLLKRLIEKGIIRKNEIYINEVKFCNYSVVKTTEGTMSGQCLNNEGGTETVTGVALKQWWGGTETVTHNNIHNNKNINIEKENICISSVPSDNTYTREKQTNRRFVKPTVEEVRAYILEKNYPIDAEQFWNFYEAKGWMIGKSPMKNWKSCIATWLKNGRSNSSEEPFVSKLNNPKMDVYDTETTWDDLISK